MLSRGKEALQQYIHPSVPVTGGSYQPTKGTFHLLRSCQMYPKDMSENAARSAGHVGKFLSQQYWVAWKISNFANIIQVCGGEVI